METRIIGSENFLAGSASNNYGVDGGFSPDLKGHNINYFNGVIAPTDTPTTVATIIGTDVLSMFSGDGIYSLACSINASLDIDIFRYQASSLSSVGSDSTHDYSTIFSDIGYLDGYYYISSLTDIFLISGVGGEDDPNWWDTTRGKSTLYDYCSHHFARLGNYLFFSNGKYLNRITNNSTVDEFFLSIDGGALDDLEITTICEHNDLIYIASQNDSNAAKSGNGGNYLIGWDGNADGLLSFKQPAPAKITAIVSYNGRLMCFTEKMLYEYNGSQFIPLRHLNGVVNKNQVKVALGNLYFIGGNDTTSANNSKFIQCYNGSSFSYLIEESATIQSIGFCFGDDLAYGTAQTLKVIDINDRVGNGKVATLPIDFISNVHVRKVIVELAENMGSGNVNTFKVYNQTGTLMTTLTMSYATDGAIAAKEFKDINFQANSIVIKADTFNNLIRRITVFYDGTSNLPL